MKIKILFIATTFFCWSFVLLNNNCTKTRPLTEGHLLDSFENRLRVQEKTYDLSGEEIRFLIRNANDSSGIVYFNMHDNENTAVQATDSILPQFGGKFIELRFKGNRWIGGWLTPSRHFWFDPNRIYSDFGIFQTLRAYSSYTPYSKQQVQKLADYILDSLLVGATTIVAVHNNVLGYSIEKYYPDSTFAEDAAKLHVNPEKSTHDFFFVLDSTHFNYFAHAGFNAVLQHDSTVADDGSLSVYCAKHKIRYINVEAMEGHLEEQVKMLRYLQGLLRE